MTLTNIAPQNRLVAGRLPASRPGFTSPEQGAGVGILALLAGAALLPACVAGDDRVAPPCEVTSFQAYRIDAIQTPVTTSQARDAGLDLDGDGTTDNAAGLLLSTLLSAFDSATDRLPASIQRSLDDRQVVWLLDVGRCADDPAYAELSLHRGSDGDGDGRYEIVVAGGQASRGQLIGGRLDTRGGDGWVPASFLADVLGDSAVEWVEGRGVAAQLTLGDDGALRGRIGFGMGDEVRPVIARPMARFFSERLAAGTLDYSAGMDADHDGVITADEFLAFNLIDAMMQPDVDLLDERFAPGTDGDNDSLSAGLEIHAALVAVE